MGRSTECPQVIGVSVTAIALNFLLTPGAHAGCPDPGQVEQDGWTLEYETTASDGLRISNVRYGGDDVIQSIKLAEWHADEEGTFGYELQTGCVGGGGGFPIFPFGDTHIVQVSGGFHVVQDFRMSSWGNDCNYRFEQRLEFYRDGRFRIASGAYGRGCGPETLYKPLVRIDLALLGDDDDSFDYWDGSDWIGLVIEDYRVPYLEPGHGPHELDPRNVAWRVQDAPSGFGYWIEPAIGQYPDEGDGDDAILFVLRHHANEGDADLGRIGTCCEDDHQVGPHLYLD